MYHLKNNKLDYLYDYFSSKDKKRNSKVLSASKRIIYNQTVVIYACLCHLWKQKLPVSMISLACSLSGVVEKFVFHIF